MGWKDDPVVAPPSGGWKDDPVVAPSPSALEAVGRGALSGATLGFPQEAYGAAKAIGGKLLGNRAGAGDIYRQARDESQASYDAAKEAHPDAYLAGEMGGGLGTLLLPGVGGAKGLAGALKVGGALGLAQGLGESKADLTKGEVLPAVGDTLLGGAAGLAGGAVGHGLGKVAGGISRALGGRAAQGVAEATADQAAKEWGTASKAYRAARSSLGGETAAVTSDYKTALDIVTRPWVYTEQQIAKAQARLMDPEFQQVVRHAADNALAESRIPESLATAEQVFASAKKGIQPQAVDAATEEALSNPIGKQVVPRLKKYATRAIPLAVGGLVGNSIGGVPGAIAGSVIGGATGAAMGDPGTSWANMLKSPAVRRAAWRAVATLARGGGAAARALGAVGSGIAARLASGDAAGAQALHEAALQLRPDYAKAVAGLLGDPQPVAVGQ